MKLKYFTLITFICMCSFLDAQTFQEKINSIFEHVDLSQVPSLAQICNLCY